MGHQEAILDAATSLFHEKGFSRTTTEEIATRASITKRTLYRYFASKEALLLAIHEGVIERLFESVNLDGSPEQRFSTLVDSYVDTVARRRDEIRVFFEERKHLSDESLARVVERRDNQERVFRDTVRQGKKSGEFRAVDVVLVTEGVLGAVASLYQWYDPAGALSAPEIAEVLVALFGQGLSRLDGWANGFDRAPRRRTARPRAASSYDAASGFEQAWVGNAVLSHILDIAARLFYERGYDNTNTRELADAAGLTKSALYYYIPNKESVLFQLNLRMTVAGIDALQGIMTAHNDPVERLQALITWQCTAIGESLGALRALNYEMRFLDQSHYMQIRTLRDQYAVLFAEVVREAATSWPDDKRGDVIVRALLGMLNFMNQWYRPGGRLSPAKIGNEFFDLVWNGLVT